MVSADALHAREARAVLQHELRRLDFLGRDPLADHAGAFLAARRRAAELGAERKEELARHDVVRELVDVAHDLGERLGFVRVDEPRAGRGGSLA